MADRFTAEQLSSGDWIVFDNNAEVGPTPYARMDQHGSGAQRVARLLNDDWEADQPAGTPEQQRQIIYRSLTIRHRIALIALLEGKTSVNDLGIEFPWSIVRALEAQDLVTVSTDLSLGLTEFGRKIAEGVLKRRPKDGYKS